MLKSKRLSLCTTQPEAFCYLQLGEFEPKEVRPKPAKQVEERQSKATAARKGRAEGPPNPPSRAILKSKRLSLCTTQPEAFCVVPPQSFPPMGIPLQLNSSQLKIGRAHV